MATANDILANGFLLQTLPLEERSKEMCANALKWAGVGPNTKLTLAQKKMTAEERAEICYQIMKLFPPNEFLCAFVGFNYDLFQTADDNLTNGFLLQTIPLAERTKEMCANALKWAGVGPNTKLTEAQKKMTAEERAAICYQIIDLFLPNELLCAFVGFNYHLFQ